MRLVFLGTPAEAVPFLHALVDEGHDVALVVTRADKRRGRGSATSPSPVKAAALERHLPVTTSVDDALDVEADLGVVVAFGRIVKPHVLERLSMVNVHFSLLPRWRGAAPVERAILAGDAKTGVCLMRLEEGLDTGPVFACEELDVAPHETADELRARLVEEGLPLLVAALRDGPPPPSPQEGEPTYAEKIDPDELHLDWSQPPEQLERIVRVGGAWTTFGGRRLKVHSARATRDGLELREVQPEGKERMAFADWARGARWRPGDSFGT